jgi:hypothetical protein
MSYSDHNCVCSGKKLSETFLCPQCEEAVKDTHDRITMDNPAAPFEARRSSAIRVLAVCRQRQSKLGLAYSL